MNACYCSEIAHEIHTCDVCVTDLHERIEELEEQIADYCNDAETWRDLYQKECIEINVVGVNEIKKIANHIDSDLRNRIEELEKHRR